MVEIAGLTIVGLLIFMQLANIYCICSKLGRARVGRYRNFYLKRPHSLLAKVSAFQLLFLIFHQTYLLYVHESQAVDLHSVNGPCVQVKCLHLFL